MNQGRRECLIGFFAAIFGSVSSAVGNALMPQKRAVPKEPEKTQPIFTNFTIRPDVTQTAEALNTEYGSPAMLSVLRHALSEHNGSLAHHDIEIQVFVRPNTRFKDHENQC